MTLDTAALAAELQSDPSGLGYHGPGGDIKPTAELGRLLTEPSAVPNPSPAPRRPVPFVVDDLLGVLTPAGRGWLVSLPFADLEPVAARVREQDGAGVVRWAAVAQLAGHFSADDVAAVEGVVTATANDPDWPVTMPGPSRLEALFGVGVVRHADIDAALGRTP